MSAAARGEAVEYRRRGWSPIPIKERSKEPNLLELRPYLTRKATKEELDTWRWSGVGIVTGPVSGVLVLDADGQNLQWRAAPVLQASRTVRENRDPCCARPRREGLRRLRCGAPVHRSERQGLRVDRLAGGGGSARSSSVAHGPPGARAPQRAGRACRRTHTAGQPERRTGQPGRNDAPARHGRGGDPRRLAGGQRAALPAPPRGEGGGEDRRQCG